MNWLKLILLFLIFSGCDSQNPLATPAPSDIEEPVVSYPKNVLISQSSIDLIIKYEISSKGYYNKFLSRPTWPGGESGLTVGVGYDTRFYSKVVIISDWRKLPNKWNEDLSLGSGVGSPEVQPLVKKLNYITIDWSLANEVFSQTTIPQYYALALRTFPEMNHLCVNAQGGGY